MTRATLRQKICGIRKKDLAKLSRNEQDVIAIATKASSESSIAWAPYTPKAHLIVYKGRIVWCIMNTGGITFKKPRTTVYVDDETGEIVKAKRFLR